MLDSTLVSVSTSAQCFGRVVEDVLTLGHIIRVWLVWVLCHEVKRPFCIRPFTNGHGWWYRHISPTLLVKHRAHCYACCYCERNLCNATFVFVSIYIWHFMTHSWFECGWMFGEKWVFRSWHLGPERLHCEPCLGRGWFWGAPCSAILGIPSSLVRLKPGIHLVPSVERRFLVRSMAISLGSSAYFISRVRWDVFWHQIQHVL